MKNLTATAVVVLLLLLGALATGIWWYNGGAADGAKAATYILLALAGLVAVLSRVLGGAWLTDNSGGR